MSDELEHAELSDKQAAAIEEARIAHATFTRSSFMRVIFRWMIAWLVCMHFWFFKLGYTLGGGAKSHPAAYYWGVGTMVVLGGPFWWAGRHFPKVLLMMDRDDDLYAVERENRALDRQIQLKAEEIQVDREYRALVDRRQAEADAQAADLAKIERELRDE